MTYLTTPLGQSEQHPLQLCHPLRVEAKESLWVKCDFGIRVKQMSYDRQPSGSFQDVVIKSSGAVLIESPQRTTLIPRCNLNHTFAQGWNRLPDELKMYIIRYVLPIDRDCIRGQGALMNPPFMHCIRSIPQSARFAEEIFYKENKFLIIPFDRPRRRFLYPNPAKNHMVRQLELVFSPSQLGSYLYKILGRLARGDYGLGNLAFLEIGIQLNNIHLRAELITIEGKPESRISQWVGMWFKGIIAFPYRGTLTLQDDKRNLPLARRDRLSSGMFSCLSDQDNDILLDTVRSKITFLP